jgi:hypothetical protein
MHSPNGQNAVAAKRAMTGLRSTLERYLSARQGLGYQYLRQARWLADCISIME